MSDNTQQIAKLVWDDKGTAREFILSKDTETSIGRDKSRDVTLSDPKVSQLHAIIAWNKNGFTITDKRSSNGTTVSGKRIHEPTDLHNGDRISIGSTTLNFVFHDISDIEVLKTKVYLRPSAGTVPKTTEPSSEMLRDSISHIETKIFASEPPKIEEEVIPVSQAELVEELKVAPNLGTSLSSLLNQIKTIHEITEALREQEEKTKITLNTTVSNLSLIAKELEMLVKQDFELEQKMIDTELIKALDDLSNKPSDVNLLIKLAGHAELIEILAKAISTHAKVLGEIKLSLGNELESLNRH